MHSIIFGINENCKLYNLRFRYSLLNNYEVAQQYKEITHRRVCHGINVCNACIIYLYNLFQGHFNFLVIYPSALNTSTPNTPDYNVTASPLHHTVTSNISTPSTFYTLSENGSLQMDNISNEMLDLIPSTSGSQKTISEISK